MSRSEPEAKLQRAILETLRVAYPTAIAWSCPNGGYVLEKRIVAKLKWLGLLPGVPDLAIYWKGGHGLIEVKSATGRLSPEQIAVHKVLREQGHNVATVRSLEDLAEVLAEWGVPGRIAA